MMLACGSTPPEREPPPFHEKLLKLSASVVPFPAVPTAVAVTVTTLPTDVAVTPTLLLRLMAAARFVAMFDVVPPSAKFAPVFTASTPPLSVAPDTVILAPLLLVRG